MLAAEEGSIGEALQKQGKILQRGFDTISNAIKYINSEDDGAIAREADLIVPNGFTSMPPFEFQGLEYFIDSD